MNRQDPWKRSKIINVIAKSIMVQTVGGTQECQPHLLVIHRYRLRQGSVGHNAIKPLCSTRLLVLLNVQSGLSKLKATSSFGRNSDVSEDSCCDRGNWKVTLGKQWAYPYLLDAYWRDSINWILMCGNGVGSDCARHRDVGYLGIKEAGDRRPEVWQFDTSDKY